MDESHGRAGGGNRQRAGNFTVDLDGSVLQHERRTDPADRLAAYSFAGRDAGAEAPERKLRGLLEKIRPLPYLDTRTAGCGIGRRHVGGPGGLSVCDGSERSAATRSEKSYPVGVPAGIWKTSLTLLPAT